MWQHKQGFEEGSFLKGVRKWGRGLGRTFRGVPAASPRSDGRVATTTEPVVDGALSLGEG